MRVVASLSRLSSRMGGRSSWGPRAWGGLPELHARHSQGQSGGRQSGRGAAEALEARLWRFFRRGEGPASAAETVFPGRKGVPPGAAASLSPPRKFPRAGKCVSQEPQGGFRPDEGAERATGAPRASFAQQSSPAQGTVTRRRCAGLRRCSPEAVGPTNAAAPPGFSARAPRSMRRWQAAWRSGRRIRLP